MQNTKLKYLAVLFVVLALSMNSACSKSDTHSSPDASQANTASQIFEQAFKEADSLRAKAAELEYEWSTTQDLLDQAKKTMLDGDSDKALQLLTEAKQQAELAIQQAKTEATAWKSRVVK